MAKLFSFQHKEQNSQMNKLIITRNGGYHHPCSDFSMESTKLKQAGTGHRHSWSRSSQILQAMEFHCQEPLYSISSPLLPPCFYAYSRGRFSYNFPSPVFRARYVICGSLCKMKAQVPHCKMYQEFRVTTAEHTTKCRQAKALDGCTGCAALGWLCPCGLTQSPTPISQSRA